MQELIRSATTDEASARMLAELLEYGAVTSRNRVRRHTTAVDWHGRPDYGLGLAAVRDPPRTTGLLRRKRRGHPGRAPPCSATSPADWLGHLFGRRSWCREGRCALHRACSPNTLEARSAVGGGEDVCDVGEWLIVEGLHLDDHRRTGQVIEAHGPDGNRPTWSTGLRTTT